MGKRGLFPAILIGFLKNHQWLGEKGPLTWHMGNAPGINFNPFWGNFSSSFHLSVVLFYCLLPLSSLPSSKHFALLKMLSIMLLPSKNIHWLFLPLGKIFSGAWTQGLPQYDHNSSFEPSFLWIFYMKTISFRVNPLSSAFFDLRADLHLILPVCPHQMSAWFYPTMISHPLPPVSGHMSKFCILQNSLQTPGESFPLYSNLQCRKYNTKLLKI